MTLSGTSTVKTSRCRFVREFSDNQLFLCDVRMICKVFILPSIFYLMIIAVVAQETTESGNKLPPLSGTSIACSTLSSEIIQRKREINERRMDLYLLEASKKGCFTVAANLLRRGASLRAKDRFGNTSLHHASRMGHNKLVLYFLDKGAEIDQLNLAGSSPLLRAVISNRRRTTKILLQAGAKFEVVNKNGITPLASAAFNGNDGILKLLLDSGAEPNRIDGIGKGPIVYAAAKGFYKIVKRLLSAGVQVNQKYANNLTALMWASGYSNDVPEVDGIKTVNLLIEEGAELNLKDNRGRTALMIAAERGHAKIVGVLREAGADLNIKDNESLTALDLAANDQVKVVLTK